MKSNKGITLIALVVTIIVLLILAGVTLAMLTGQNGVLSNAQKAKRETAQAETQEKINLLLSSIRTEVYAQQVQNKTYSGLAVSGTGTSATVTDVDGAIKTLIKNDLNRTDTFTVGAKNSQETSESTIKATPDGWHFYLDGWNTVSNTDAGNTASETTGTITIAYKDTDNNYFAYGRITVSNNTSKIATDACKAVELVTDQKDQNN